MLKRSKWKLLAPSWLKMSNGWKKRSSKMPRDKNRLKTVVNICLPRSSIMSQRRWGGEEWRESNANVKRTNSIFQFMPKLSFPATPRIYSILKTFSKPQQLFHPLKYASDHLRKYFSPGQSCILCHSYHTNITPPIIYSKRNIRNAISVLPALSRIRMDHTVPHKAWLSVTSYLLPNRSKRH